MRKLPHVNQRRIERREFLWLAASGALATSGLLGCGSSSTAGNDDGDGDGDANAPELEFVMINEYDSQVVLTGNFGVPAINERSVVIDGETLPVVTWREHEIVCELPLVGRGSAGDVQVNVREEGSNVRRITEWNTPLRYRLENLELPDLKVEGDVALRFRADVGQYSAAVRAAVPTRDSIASLTASGSGVDHAGCIESWTGQVDFLPEQFQGATGFLLASRFKVDTVTKQAAIGLGYGAPFNEFLWTIECPNANGTVSLGLPVSFGQLQGSVDFPSPAPGYPSTPLFAIKVSLGPDYQIPAGHLDETLVGKISLDWDEVPARFPP